MTVMMNPGLYYIEYFRNQDQSLTMMYSSIYEPDRKYVSWISTFWQLKIMK